MLLQYDYGQSGPLAVPQVEDGQLLVSPPHPPMPPLFSFSDLS